MDSREVSATPFNNTPRKLKIEKVTLEIRKTEAIHNAKIQNWDLYDTAEEESCRFSLTPLKMRGLLISRRR